MNRGFSIPELLVVVAIIVLMTGLLLINWRSGERSLALSRVVHKAGQDVRRVQELALRAQAYICPNAPIIPTETISGYGVFFNQDSPDLYILFAECNHNNTYNEGIDGIVEAISLESGITISSVAPNSKTSIVFVPPTPQVFINGNTDGNMQVSFQRTDGVGNVKILDVNAKGVIDVD